MKGRRVAVYVDGFNLYYGLRSKGWRRFYWLDVRALAENLLRPGQRLVGVRYFTSRIAGLERGRQRRQTVFLEALETLSDVEIQYGHHLSKPRECRVCGAQWTVYEEKMTDVNIAVRLLVDAQDDVFDTAILISADGDLAGPVETLLDRYEGKRVVVVFPPGRRSDRLRDAAPTTFRSELRMRNFSRTPCPTPKARSGRDEPRPQDGPAFPSRERRDLQRPGPSPCERSDRDHHRIHRADCPPP